LGRTGVAEVLCLGTLGTELKKVINEPRTNIRTVELLLDLVLSNASIKNQRGEDCCVTDASASDTLACKIPVHREIRKAASTSVVINASEEYVEDAIIAEIPDYGVDDLIQKLGTLIRNDSTIPKAKRDALMLKATTSSVIPFFADVLLYVLKKQNRFDELSTIEPTNTEYENLLNDLAEANRRLQGAPRPTAMPVPTVADEEMEIRYVSALLDAYADAEKLNDLQLGQLIGYPKYKKNFDRQRKDFYAAETVRHSARDAFGTDNDAFDSLRNETYDGIIDVHSLDYSDGYDRLNHVLSHATTLSFPNCIIQKADWLGKSESADKITALDFIASYGADFGIGTTNLYGSNSFSYSELSVRRALSSLALKELVLRGIADARQSDDGFEYSSNNAGLEILIDDLSDAEIELVAERNDVVVAGKTKSAQGQGYRGFLNTVMAIALKELIDAQGAYNYC
jgi:hypothetical protein